MQFLSVPHSVTLLLVGIICNRENVNVSAFSRSIGSPIRSRMKSTPDRTLMQLQTPHQSCHHLSPFKLKPLSIVALSDYASSYSSEKEVGDYFEQLISRFQGDFDNYNQVIQDRHHGLTPGEGGGHEHIHCTLVPCPRQLKHNSSESFSSRKHQDQWVLAAFYFNGNPQQIFRFRMYRLIPPEFEQGKSTVRMILHTLSPELEGKLRKNSDDPCKWWVDVWDILIGSRECNLHQPEVESDEIWKLFQSTGLQSLVSSLPGCDVLWNPKWDPSKHSYLCKDENGGTESTADDGDALDPLLGCHATMEAGSKGAIVDSISMIPGKRILVKDELSLWDDNFWINDRGYDPDVAEIDANDSSTIVMPYVYGNRRGVPYKLERVTRMFSAKANYDKTIQSLSLGIEIINEDLEWTLGDKYRTEMLFRNKMKAVHSALESKGFD
mmetsp:Transcript_32052/g.65421  ORF Transcript_32052/g.65421 Transcript_32052/m.65421 type:complete len:438 (+) Transcript_32052:115-1428(+)